jgi:hypothetical protein
MSALGQSRDIGLDLYRWILPLTALNAPAFIHLCQPIVGKQALASLCEHSIKIISTYASTF